ncbi:MAG: carbohydrate kinase [bacterium]|nr:carbohydrate kinase [bacterium]
MTREAPDRWKRPVVFGEVLLDCFEDGATVLGGAPYNVAWHLKGLGLDPLLLTRVGSDPRGDGIRAAMLAAGLDTTGVQVDPDLPTGTVNVSILDGQPRFEIAPGQAFDAIDTGQALAAVDGGEGSLLYHGTLALRTPANADALSALRQRTRLPVFLDVNLRDPWWNHEVAESALAGACWIKLNEDELRRLGGSASTPESAARRLAERWQPASLIVTSGAEGAFWIDDGGLRASVPAAPVQRMVDTVGAGDAFAAACIAGLASGQDPAALLARAARLAAAVCSCRGAIPADAEFPARFLAEER